MRCLAEGGSRFFQFALYGSYERVPATKHASCDAFRFLKRRHGLAEIVERGAGVHRERVRVDYAYAGKPSYNISAYIVRNAARRGPVGRRRRRML